MESQHLQIINQVFELEKKINANTEFGKLQRNVERIKGYYEEMGLRYHNPIGEKFDETRTDCTADIVGDSAQQLVITEVIKPIVISTVEGNTIVQKGVVIVEGK